MSSCGLHQEALEMCLRNIGYDRLVECHEVQAVTYIK